MTSGVGYTNDKTSGKVNISSVSDSIVITATATVGGGSSSGNSTEKKDEIEPKPEQGFEDVKENDWYYDAVIEAVKKGWFNGTGDTTFSPYIDTTRGMIATILQRIENGVPVEVAIFTDIDQSAYYADAVAGANENKLVKG